jgi:hypothetical protein
MPSTGLNIQAAHTSHEESCEHGFRYMDAKRIFSSWGTNRYFAYKPTLKPFTNTFMEHPVIVLIEI